MASYSSIEYTKGSSAYNQTYISWPSSQYGISRYSYFRMLAYDTSANTWRTWIATGAPDLTAVQYNGTAFPFTQVFVAARL
jgi:hypothetical protein